MDTKLIQFKNIEKTFGKLVVLDGISFSIEKGEVTTIIGKSGAGKSVLLKLIIGLLQPDSGTILFDGISVSELNRKGVSKLKSRIGYLFQNVALFDSMTVFENVALPLKEKTKLSKKKIKEKVYDKLEKLEILHAESKYPSEISGGMKKRVGLARALIMDPEIILFDEPTTGLDPIRKNAVHSMISHMQRKLEFTAVVVSHEIPDVLHISQKILMLESGKIIADCPPHQLDKIDNPFVQGFLKGTEILKNEPSGYYAKTSITHRFDETFGKLADSEKNCSLIVLKIDELDHINESTGFVVGQKIVQHLASEVEDILSLSPEDFRYYDDFIVAILRNTSTLEAKNFLKKLKIEMKRCSPFPIQGNSAIPYTVSAGTTELDECKSVDDLMKPALENMTQISHFNLSQ